MGNIICRRLSAEDIDPLLHYLQNLSNETRKRFGPHSFERDGLVSFYNSDTGLAGYIVIDLIQQEIIAYTVIKYGILQHDRSRLTSHGLIDPANSCTFAPSVADKWQSRGIGKMLFNYVLNDLSTAGVQKIILWGGVQATNEKAINFYKRAGFKIIGEFEYNGSNLDMLLEINKPV